MMTNSIQPNNKGDVVYLLKKWFAIVLYTSIVGEIIFFLSWENMMGCLMELIVWHIFNGFFLKRKIILEHPFSFLTFLSMFLARYLPLPATLLEGKPITYGFEMPFDTFFWETVMFCVASMAFYTSIHYHSKKTNKIQKWLFKIGFFKTDPITLWILGLIGIAVRIQQLIVAGEVEFGDVNNKFLAGLLYLQYTPIIMLFPTLCGISKSKSRNLLVWLYIAVLFITSFATNSRQSMIFPIFTLILLYFIYVLIENISVFKLLSPKKIIILGFFVFVGLNFISDISLAMLATRKVRSDISRAELFEKTVQTLQNDGLMEQLRNTSIEERGQLISYSNGWDERYINNFMLNRFGNLRVSDETIYYAHKIGFSNPKMQDSFESKALAIFPLPLLAIFNVKLDKNQLLYSPGDMLFMTGGGANALGGYRVTSLVADGLATFGLWSFPLIFILLFFSFKLLDCFVIFRNNQVMFSTIGLINIFGFLGMYRNSIGLTVPLAYILRGFWQLCFTYWLVVFIIQLLPYARGRKN
ncbi:hypothetical protein CLV98_11282 [Dyadobacter jejuensis]|uniref:O-antigen polysaccharide polymerase Wzy-like protein n=1 Tax=Dyadobacter jejuensis TaxID=1082580 RepID=A0A316B0F8_9BACT|nr:hypothetical protein [Dyadobacter jejuensis]PWJ55987.1 hypothetical protein CLV98_11282 [Dyadobacter jejuensis]